MAEGASAVPTFKLVLVGDGGTGKVCWVELVDVLLLVLLGEMPSPSFQYWWRMSNTDPSLTAR
jgi:hypothetical protein